MLWPAIDPGLHTVYDRTIAYQADRDSPFSIWGQVPSLEPLRVAILVATGLLAIAFAFIPKHKTLVQVAALGAALLISPPAHRPALVLPLHRLVLPPAPRSNDVPRRQPESPPECLAKRLRRVIPSREAATDIVSGAPAKRDLGSSGGDSGCLPATN